MTAKTILEFANDSGISKKKVENVIAKLKKQGTILGTLKGGKRYLSKADQDRLENSIFSNLKSPKNDTNKAPEDEEKRYLKERIITLERLLENQQILTKQALDDKTQLQLELTENKSKSFWKRLFKNN